MACEKCCHSHEGTLVSGKSILNLLMPYPSRACRDCPRYIVICNVFCFDLWIPEQSRGQAILYFLCGHDFERGEIVDSANTSRKIDCALSGFRKIENNFSILR